MELTKGSVYAVRADGAELIFDFVDADGYPYGYLRQKNGTTSTVGLFDKWQKVGNWTVVDAFAKHMSGQHDQSSHGNWAQHDVEADYYSIAPRPSTKEFYEQVGNSSNFSSKDKTVWIASNNVVKHLTDVPIEEFLNTPMIIPEGFSNGINYVSEESVKTGGTATFTTPQQIIEAINDPNAVFKWSYYNTLWVDRTNSSLNGTNNKTQTVAQKEKMIKQFAVVEVMEQWAKLQNSNPLYYALNDVVREDFGLKNTFVTGHPEKIASQVAKILVKNHNVLQSITTAMYEETQKTFADEGIKAVELWRGFDLLDESLYGTESKQTIRMQPLSCWTSKESVAKTFGNAVTKIVVPVENVFSTYATGLGAEVEQEHVLLGGTIQANVWVSQPRSALAGIMSHFGGG